MSNLPRDKRFFECGDWVDILAINNITEQPDEIHKRFFRESREDGYRREYYMTLNLTETEGPDWEDLTEGQRENIRQIQNQHAQDMHAFGHAIAAGSCDQIEEAGNKLIGKI